MRDFWIQITGRTLGYDRHVASVQDYEVELSPTYYFTDTKTRRQVVTKATVMKWARLDVPFTVSGTEIVQPRFFTWRFGFAIASEEYHADKIKTASTGWLKTAADDTGEDNIINLPEPDSGTPRV